MKINKFFIKLTVLFILIMLLIASLTINIILYQKYKKDSILVVKPEVKIDQKVIDAPEKIKKLMLLPQDEKPQIIKITETFPRNQDFIKDTKNGDLLLIYLQNQIAIIYDPEKNQIIKVGPLLLTPIPTEIK